MAVVLSESLRYLLLSARRASAAVSVVSSGVKAGRSRRLRSKGGREPVLAVTHAVRDLSPSLLATSPALRDYHVATA